jgi:hypothetical protein
MANPIRVETVVMGALRLYAALLEQLYLARADRPLSMEEEYEFTCELEALWEKLSDGEQHDVEVLTEEYKRAIQAPDQLTTDLEVVLHGHTRPRAA